MKIVSYLSISDTLLKECILQLTVTNVIKPRKINKCLTLYKKEAGLPMVTNACAARILSQIITTDFSIS